MTAKWTDPFERADRWLARVESVLLILVMIVMIGLAATQLYLRKFHDFGFDWADILIRQLVLWIAFLGGTHATHQGRHIAIDAAAKLLPAPWSAAIRVATGIAATVITLVMAAAAWTFLLDEIESDSRLMGVLRQWWFVAIIPATLVATAVHFLVATRRTIIEAIGQDGVRTAVRFFGSAAVTGLAATAAAFAGWSLIGIGAAAIFGLAVFGLPLFATIGGLTMLGYRATETDISTLIIEMSGVASAPALVAIPMFTFAGYLMAESNTPNRLVALARGLVGWMPGGLAVVAVVACAFFTAFTGASGITIIALGGLLFPILIKEGFPERFSLGLLTSGGSLGLLFPPSLPVILYAIVAGVDVDRLFVAALIPGAILVGFMAAYSAVVAMTTERVRRIPFRLSALTAVVWQARWELPLPVIILWGIYGGWLTVNEAAVVTVLVVLVVQCGLYRDLHLFRDVPKIAIKSAVLVGAILLILGVALGLTSYLILEEVPDQLLNVIQRNVTTKIGFLIALNIFLLIVGCLLDIFSAIIVVVPLILPLAQAYGVNPLHLGVIFLTNLEIGYMTPPVGMNLFLSAFRFQKSLPTLYLASLPFIAVLLAALMLITYVPALSLWLGGS